MSALAWRLFAGPPGWALRLCSPTCLDSQLKLVFTPHSQVSFFSIANERRVVDSVLSACSCGTQVDFRSKAVLATHPAKAGMPETHHLRCVWRCLLF